MRPQFNPKLTLSKNRRSVHVEGPIDLDGTEVDASFWMRLAQGTGANEVEAIGILDLNEAQLKQLYETAAQDTKDAALGLAAARLTAGPAGAKKAFETISAAGPSWRKPTLTARDKKTFTRNKTALAEAWALVRTKNEEGEEGEEGEFQMYWKKDVKLV